MKALSFRSTSIHISERWQRILALLVSVFLVAAGLFTLLWLLFPAYAYMVSLVSGGLLGLGALFWLIVQGRRLWSGARIRAIAGVYSAQPMEVKAMATFDQLQNWYTRQLGQMIIQHGIHARAKVARGPFTLTFTLNLTRDVAQGLRNLQSLKPSLMQVLRSNVRVTNSPDGVLLEVELPRGAQTTPSATKLASASRWPNIPIGIDQFMRPVTVNPEEHGALYWIAPPRSGKTSSMRSALAIAKQYAPDLRFVICALGAKLNRDWGVFGGIDGCLGLISEPKEMEEALTWLVAEMNKGVHGPVFIVLDDLTNLTSQANLASQIDDLALAGAGLGYHLLVGTHGAGSKVTTGGQRARFGMTCKILYKAADNNSASASAGRRNVDTGLDQLSGYPGDAILDEHGRITRVATARITDVEIMALPAAANPQPRPWAKRKPVTNGVTNGVTGHGLSQSGRQVVTPLVTPSTTGRSDLSQVVTLSQSQLATPVAAGTCDENAGVAGVTVTECDNVTGVTTGNDDRVGEIELPTISPERDATLDEARLILSAWETGDYSLSGLADKVYGQRNKRRNGRIQAAIALANNDREDHGDSDDESNDMTRDLAMRILTNGQNEHPRRSEALVFMQKEVVIEGKGWNEKGKPKASV